MRHQPITGLDHLAANFRVTTFIRLIQGATAEQDKKRANRQQQDSPLLPRLAKNRVDRFQGDLSLISLADIFVQHAIDVAFRQRQMRLYFKMKFLSSIGLGWLPEKWLRKRKDPGSRNN